MTQQTADRHRERMRRFDHLRTLLITATRERENRSEWVEGELAWVRHERQVMLDAVNALRATDGLPALPVEQIRAAEDLACGHIDYVN